MKHSETGRFEKLYEAAARIIEYDECRNNDYEERFSAVCKIANASNLTDSEKISLIVKIIPGDLDG